MPIGIGELFIFLVVPIALQFWAMIDMLRRPDAHWRSTDQQKLVWVLVVLFGSILGVLLYTTIARPKLKGLDPQH